MVSWVMCRRQHNGERQLAKKQEWMDSLTEEQRAEWEAQRGVKYGGPPSLVDPEAPQAAGTRPEK